MAQEHLDRPDIDARFAQVGRKAVAQRMDTVAVGDLSAQLRMLGELLGRADGQRPVGIAPRQQPRSWPREVPGGTQCGQQAGGEERGAILAPFALLDADQHPITCDIRQREPDDFANAQASGRGGHQEDAVPGMLRTREQALECLDAPDPWELRPPRPWGKVEVEDIPVQGLRREELQPCSRLIAGTPRQAPLDQEVVQGGTNLLWTEAVWGALGELCQAGDSSDRGLVRFRGQPLQWHVVDHLGT
jgi:hypothetical protein